MFYDFLWSDPEPDPEHWLWVQFLLSAMGVADTCSAALGSVVACGGAVVVVAFSLDAVPADAIPLVVQLLTILLLKVLLL